MECAPGGDWFIPGGDHANLCLAWCRPDVRLAHIPCHVFYECLTCLALGSGESWCTKTVISAQSHHVYTSRPIRTRVASTFIRVCVVEIDIAL